MKKIFLSIFAGFSIAFLPLCALAETIVNGDYTFTLKADHDGGLYKKGEIAKFNLKASKKDSKVEDLSLFWIITKDGTFPKTQANATLKEGKFQTSEVLNEAGFLRCEMYITLPDGKKVQIQAGAAFDPDEIKPSLPIPSDFKKYWDKQRKILSKIPMNPEMKLVEQKDLTVEVFDVKADSFEGLMRGYYARPTGAKPKSCPAIVLPHGAGVVTSWMGNATGWAKRGFIALDFNAHGILNGQPKEFYENLKNTDLKDYRYWGMNEDRDALYFRKMYMRVMRALDFIKSQPEWDGRILVINGTSQGGGQAIVGAALDPKVSFATVFVPALCDHSGSAVNRINGWPRFITQDKDGNYDKKIVENVRYVDAMNFAAFIKCPVLFTVDYADNVCAPTSVYAAYANVKSKKSINVFEEARHSVPKEGYAKGTEAILKHVEEIRANSN